MTRIVGPSHVRDAHTYGFNKDADSLAECSGRAVSGNKTVPYCGQNKHGCAFHYPSEYKGRHVREPLPVTVGGYGMAPGATGYPFVLIKGERGSADVVATLFMVVLGFIGLFLLNQWAECGMIVCSGVR